MPAQRKPVAHDTVMRVRDDYMSGRPVADIRAEYDLTADKFYRLLAGEDDADGLPRLKLRRGSAGVPASRDARASLVDRLWKAADRQVRDIERRLRLDAQKPDDRERDARVLATTVKTLRDLRALDEARAETEPAAADEQRHDNLDDFRRELARKMDAIIAGRAAGTADGAER